MMRYAGQLDWQVWLPQYRCHLAALPLITMAQLRSTPSRRSQKAAVREPLPLPLLMHVSGGALTLM